MMAFFFVRLKVNCWDAKTRMHECDVHGVHVQVLEYCTCDVFMLDKTWQMGLLYQNFLTIILQALFSNILKRFVGLGTVPLQTPELAIKMEKV